MLFYKFSPRLWAVFLAFWRCIFFKNGLSGFRKFISKIQNQQMLDKEKNLTCIVKKRFSHSRTWTMRKKRSSRTENHQKFSHIFPEIRNCRGPLIEHTETNMFYFDKLNFARAASRRRRRFARRSRKRFPLSRRTWAAWLNVCWLWNKRRPANRFKYIISQVLLGTYC